jgi:hypothetical protein
VTLGPDEQHRDITVKMTPCGAISGRVLGANGESLDSIMAIAERGHMILSVTTDEKGQFRPGSLDTTDQCWSVTLNAKDDRAQRVMLGRTICAID